MTRGAGSARRLGLPPRSKTSTMCMAPPQMGQGHTRSAAACSGVSAGTGSEDGAESRSRALAMLSALPPLARKPEWRMRWKPFGSTWINTRRMNSPGSSVIVVYRAAPLVR